MAQQRTKSPEHTGSSTKSSVKATSRRVKQNCGQTQGHTETVAAAAPAVSVKHQSVVWVRKNPRSSAVKAGAAKARHQGRQQGAAARPKHQKQRQSPPPVAIHVLPLTGLPNVPALPEGPAGNVSGVSSAARITRRSRNSRLHPGTNAIAGTTTRSRPATAPAPPTDQA